MLNQKRERKNSTSNETKKKEKKPKKENNFTVSIVIPSSIVDNAQVLYIK